MSIKFWHWSVPGPDKFSPPPPTHQTPFCSYLLYGQYTDNPYKGGNNERSKRIWTLITTKYINKTKQEKLYCYPPQFDLHISQNLTRRETSVSRNAVNKFMIKFQGL